MRLPELTASSPTLLQSSLFTTVRLKADPQTVAFLPPVEAVHRRVSSTLARRVSLHEVVIECLALRAAADFNLDGGLIQTSLLQLARVGNNRNDPGFTTIFRMPASTMAALPPEEEVAEVELLEARLAALPEGDELRTRSLPLLTAQRQQLQGAVTNLRAAMQAEAAARADELIAREEWRRTIQRLYGLLLAELPGQKARVESFFRAAKRRRSDEAEDDDEVVVSPTGEAGTNG